MTYLPRAYLSTDEKSPVDAFARLRFSTPVTLLDTKQLYDSLPLYYDDSQVSGSGTSSSHSVNRASTTMSVTATTAGKRVRQTFFRPNYSPGKSQLVVLTFVMGTNGSGVKKEVGLFDNSNGLFFRMDGTTPKFVVRSNVTGTPVDTEITQSNWNNDKLDGTGNSGVTLDFTKSLILFIDFEWLGVGAVRYGFFVGGQPIVAHIQRNANVGTSVYMSTPNLPVRYSIENDGTGGALSFEHICSTVISEGGYEPVGQIISKDRGITGFSTGANTSLHPIFSIRLKSTHIGATIDIQNFNILVATNNATFRYGIYLNPTIAGTDAASWTSISNSAIEYDITRDNTNTLSGGTQIFGGYGSTTIGSFAGEIKSALKIGSNIAGTRDQLVLAVQNLSASNDTYYGGLAWKELL